MITPDIRPVFFHKRPKSMGAVTGGFSMVELVLAIALFSTVLLGMLVLLANAVDTRRQIRRDTLGVQIGQQVQQALRGFRQGIDDSAPAVESDHPGVLDVFYPFSFAEFPTPGMAPMVLGFNAHGMSLGKIQEADYASGTSQTGVEFLMRIEGRPIAGVEGVTEVRLAIEHPADVAQAIRKKQEFYVRMVPQVVSLVQRGGER